MAHVKWTRSAQNELEDIVYYIAIKDHRREVAKKIYDEIKSKCGIEVMAVLDGSRRYESYFQRPSDPDA